MPNTSNVMRAMARLQKVARRRWPDITDDEFAEAGLAACGTFRTPTIDEVEMQEALMAELERRRERVLH